MLRYLFSFYVYWLTYVKERKDLGGDGIVDVARNEGRRGGAVQRRRRRRLRLDAEVFETRVKLGKTTWQNEK